jgi:hypothetical protein
MAQSPLHETLDRIPGAHRDQISEHREKYESVRWEKIGIERKPVLVPRSSETPEGFAFDLPSPPYRPYEREVREGALTPVLPFPGKVAEAFDEAYGPMKDRYETRGSGASPDFAALVAEMEATEAEMGRFQRLLSEERKAARRVLNAWAHMIVKEAGLTPSEVRKGTDWHARHRSVQQGLPTSEQTNRENAHLLSGLNPMEARPHFSDSDSEQAGKVCRRLWLEVVEGEQRTLAEATDEFGDYFSLPAAVTISAKAGMLLHARKVNEHMWTLLRLDARLVAGEVVRNALLLGNSLPGADVLVEKQKKQKERAPQFDKEKWEQRKRAVARVLLVKSKDNGEINVRRGWEDFPLCELFKKVGKKEGSDNRADSIRKYFRRRLGNRYPGKDSEAWAELARSWAEHLPPWGLEAE